MKKTANRWVVVAALVAAAVAVVGTFLVHGWSERRRADAVAADRQAFLARFGILSDGRSPFVALPPVLPHGSLQAGLGASLRSLTPTTITPSVRMATPMALPPGLNRFSS